MGGSSLLAHATVSNRPVLSNLCTVITMKIWGGRLGKIWGGLCPPGPSLEPPLALSTIPQYNIPPFLKINTRKSKEFENCYWYLSYIKSFGSIRKCLSRTRRSYNLFIANPRNISHSYSLCNNYQYQFNNSYITHLYNVVTDRMFVSTMLEFVIPICLQTTCLTHKIRTQTKAGREANTKLQIA